MKKLNQLSDEIIPQIVKEMQIGVFSLSERLPPEVELARRYGVSRSVLRECLARLEREGIVTRKHGVGTLINRQILGTDFRLDLNGELIPTIEHTGKKARMELTGFCRSKAEDWLAEKLAIKAGDDIIISERLIYADETPAVFCTDYISLAGVTDFSFTEKDLLPSVYTFVKKYAGVDVEMELSEIRAIPADTKTASLFKLPVGTPLLAIEEVSYDFSGKPVFFSKVCYIDRIIHHVIVRKKI
jgi:GntR family transcriptional regulator